MDLRAGIGGSGEELGCGRSNEREDTPPLRRTAYWMQGGTGSGDGRVLGRGKGSTAYEDKGEEEAGAPMATPVMGGRYGDGMTEECEGAGTSIWTVRRGAFDF